MVIGQMDQTETVQDPGTLWSILAKTADLLETRPDVAERQARAILESVPGQQQTLQLLVSARRVLGDVAGACALLTSMAHEHPDLASVHYELGLLLAELGDRDAAVSALSRVVKLEPNHPYAWRALGDAQAEVGNRDEAANAYARQFASSVMDVKMLEQMTTLDLDQIEIAGSVLREFLGIHPTDLAALEMLGQTHMRVSQFETAENLFAHALELAPTFRRARRDYVSVLRQQMKSEEEIRQLDILLEDDPDNPDYRYLKATALFNAGRHQESIRYCESILQEEPDRPRFWVAYGYALRTAGRQEACIAALRKAIELEPGLSEGWWDLANLKTYRFSPAEIQIMRAQLERADLDEKDRYQLDFTLGKALEDRADYAGSFEHYRRGNALIRSRNPYDADEISRNVQREKARYTREYFHTSAGLGCSSPEPIFILGLARSGSTLVEQILASHSMVEGGGELLHLNAIARRLGATEDARSQSIEGEPLPPLQGEDLRALGEEYLQRASANRKLGRPYFTDKMPNNFHHLGLICATLPNSKIIDIRRHPLACCFSNFKQIFQLRQGASYDLADMGRYYRDYVDMLAHFGEVLPGRIHRVIYEDLVRDPDTEIRRLLAYCGLPFEDACLKFHETDRGILTISSEQVRQPVYTASVEQWRHYDQWLGPCKTALGSVLDSYPAVPENF